MGQRTQMLIQTVNNKGEKKNHLYHFQWGFGRTMFLQLMDLFINDYFKDTFKRGYSVFDVTRLTNKASDITEEVEIPEDLDITDIEQIKKVFKQCDNNNGGMVIQVNENDPSYSAFNYKVGLLLGSEETYDYENDKISEEPFSRYVSYQEYFDKAGGQFCGVPSFVKMWEGFVEFAEIEFLR